MLAAISPLSVGLVGGPVVSARVLGVFPTAVYLAVPAAARDAGHVSVLPVVTSDALLLPTAVRLPGSAAAVAWGVSIGDRVPVGAGRVGLSALGGVSVVRQWRPSQVARRSGGISHAGWSPSAAARFVDSRLGRGVGLTPDGDDELCGALLVAHVLCVGRNALRDNVIRALSRTTSLSASLLRAAGDGYAVPELAAYVEAVLPPRDRPDAALLRARVDAIGHSSGAALLRGVDLGLQHLYATSTTSTTSTREPACA